MRLLLCARPRGRRECRRPRTGACARARHRRTFAAGTSARPLETNASWRVITTNSARDIRSPVKRWIGGLVHALEICEHRVCTAVPGVGSCLGSAIGIVRSGGAGEPGRRGGFCLPCPPHQPYLPHPPGAPRVSRRALAADGGARQSKQYGSCFGGSALQEGNDCIERLARDWREEIEKEQGKERSAERGGSEKQQEPAQPQGYKRQGHPCEPVAFVG